MAALPLKVSRNEQRSVICFRWAKGRSANAIKSEMCPVYMTSVLLDQQYMFGVKSLFMVKKVLLMRKDLVAWSPCCFDDRCNDRSSRFSRAC